MTCVQPRQEALLSRLRADERGDVTSSILIFPIVMIVILLGVHFSLVLHGRNVAAAAAQDGVQAAQLQLAGPGDGSQAAMNTLSLFPGIRGAQVELGGTLDTVTVTISGEVETPLDFLYNKFEVTRSGPRERFYFESERE